MRPAVFLSADQLEERHAREIERACAGWTETFRRIPQSLPRAELVEMLAHTNVVIGWTVPDLLLPSAVSTYLCGSAGYDAYIGIGLGGKAGFRLTNAAGVMTVPIAEHCLALMFALTRQLPVIFEQQIRRHYERRWNAEEVCGTKACIVGLGGVGTELARRCRALGLHTVGVGRTPARHAGVTDELFGMAALDDALADAGHVFCVLPGGPETRGVFNAARFARMKRGARYYTASRGSVTDEEALIDALRSGHLAGAGVDVFAQEPLPVASALWTLPNVIVSPHSAGLSTKLNDRLTALFVENLKRLHDGRALANQIPAEALD